jgi:hypothetical protein
MAGDEATARIWLPVLEAFEGGAFAFFVTDREIFVSTLPAKVAVDEGRRPHCADGPAFVWLDDVRDHYWHGVHVEPWIVTDPGRITIKAINGEKNIEVRRVMIERYGEDRYIADSRMRPVASDRFGSLYIQRLEAGRPIARVKVRNGTAEPDGTFRSYLIPVNPDLYGGDAGRYPQAAVASTWRTTPGGKELLFKNWQDYQPVIET